MTDTAMAARRPKIAIVGGGIGGLFAASALIARGFEVAVYEQAAALGEVGAGVALTPNSVRHLRRLGLESSRLEKWGVRFGPGSHYFRHDGTPIAPVQVTDLSGWSAMFGMHRADLVNLLAAALPPAIIHTGHRCTAVAQDRQGRTGNVRQWGAGRSRYRRWGRWHSLGAPALRCGRIHSEVPRHDRLSRHVRARAHARLADGSVADVARAGKALSGVPAPRRPSHQLCRLRSGRRGDEGILVARRRSGRASLGVRRMGPAHRGTAAACRDDVPLGALRSRAAADLDRGPADAARRCRASDASPPRTGRQPVDRGRNGARDDFARDGGPTFPRRCSRTSGCAASVSRRSSAARARADCATTPLIPILASGTPRSARMRRFAERLRSRRRSGRPGRGRNPDVAAGLALALASSAARRAIQRWPNRPHREAITVRGVIFASGRQAPSQHPLSLAI